MTRASFRYRALFPAFRLNEMGIDTIVFSDFNKSLLKSLTIIIFVKAFTPKDYDYALKAKDKGIPIILDLCDNMLYKHYQSKYDYSKLFIKFASIATHIIVTTEAIKKMLLDTCSNNTSVTVIKDGLETLPDLKTVHRFYMTSISKQLIRRRKSKRQMHIPFLTKYEASIRENYKQYKKDFKLKCVKNIPFLLLKKRPKVLLPKRTQKKILWFGIHGGPHTEFGMLDLLSLQNPLERVAKLLDIELVIVSNSYAKYKNAILPFKLPTCYLEWSPRLIHHVLNSTNIVILPSQFNDFVNSKSENRAILSLTAGVPVVATYKSIYKDFLGCMLFDDFYKGIVTYLTQPELVTQHLNIAQEIINKAYSHNVLSSQRLSLFNQIVRQTFKHKENDAAQVD